MMTLTKVMDLYINHQTEIATARATPLALLKTSAVKLLKQLITSITSFIINYSRSVTYANIYRNQQFHMGGFFSFLIMFQNFGR